MKSFRKFLESYGDGKIEPVSKFGLVYDSTIDNDELKKEFVEGKNTVKTVTSLPDTNSFITGQKEVDSSIIQEYLNGKEPDKVITLVDKKDGNLYVIDGHHRLSSILLGNPNKFTFEIWSKPNA